MKNILILLCLTFQLNAQSYVFNSNFHFEESIEINKQEYLDVQFGFDLTNKKVCYRETDGEWDEYIIDFVWEEDMYVKKLHIWAETSYYIATFPKNKTIIMVIQFPYMGNITNKKYFYKR